MATKSRRETTGVKARFYKEPWRFSFFQAVRLIQNVFSQESVATKKLQPVGKDAAPVLELVTFSSPVSMAFSSADVIEVSSNQGKVGRKASVGDKMKVGFMGVAGVNGALPTHYTESMLQRQRAKDSAMYDFYDLFNHRAVSFFYRAWQKYRLAFCYESHMLHGKPDTVDPITNALLAFVGRRVTSTDTKTSIDQATKLLLFAGVYASSQRSPVTLSALLSDYFKVSAKIEQFVGEWSDLYDDDKASLGSCDGKRGENNALGINTLIGTRVYCVESRFRIIIGPLTKAEFLHIKPGSNGLYSLCDFVRGYVGPNVKFDLKLILESKARSGTRIKSAKTEASNLGWDTWLIASNRVSGTEKITEIHVPSQGMPVS